MIAITLCIAGAPIPIRLAKSVNWSHGYFAGPSEAGLIEWCSGIALIELGLISVSYHHGGHASRGCECWHGPT